jgi:glycosyltransferase involved in cell wall biosynthesis
VPGARLCTLVSGLDLRLLRSHWQDARGAAGLGRFALTALGTLRRLPQWRRLLRASVAVVGMSADIAAGLRRYRAHALTNFLDTACFAPDAATRGRVRGQLGLADGDCAVVMVGAFTWQKGVHVGLAACADVARARPSVVAVVAGDGPAREPVARALRARAPQLRTRLLGETPHDAVRGLLAAGDVFLMPTLRQEAMPTLTMLEAMAAGLPVVTTRPTAAPPGVVDGESGAVVPPGDAAALARALAPLVDDGPRRRAMGAAARRAATAYDQAAVVPRLVEIARAARSAP